MRIIDITLEHRSLLERFIANLGHSADTFRYFSRRPIDVIASHRCTKLLLDEEGEPIGYGHLDPEGEKVWLGICLTERCVGQGYGKQLMEALIESARAQAIPTIHLSVDNVNTRARALYERYGFAPEKVLETMTMYKLTV